MTSRAQILGSGATEGSTMSAAAICIERASGVHLWDTSGKRYLDLISQTWSMPLGHNHPAVTEAVQRQLQKVTHVRTAFVTEDKLRLIAQLTAHAPTGLTKVNFALHGSLAVEGAMKLAINSHDDRHKVLYLQDGFHGRSFATMGISWKGITDKYRGYFSHGVEVQKTLEDVESKMRSERPAAIVLELVQGNSGFLILDPKFVEGVRQLCDRHGVVLIIDEVQTAFGCVEELFLSQRYKVEPDILVFGKAIGGGFPLAGMLYRDRFEFKPGEHSFTFGHSPISFAAANAFLETLLQERHRATPLNACVSNGLAALERRHWFLSGARSMGTKGAVDVTGFDRERSCALATLAVEKMQEQGIIIASSRYRGLGNTLMLQAPLLASVGELNEAFGVLDGVLAELGSLRTVQAPAVLERPVSAFVLGEEELLDGVPENIRAHSSRHARLCARVAECLNLPKQHVEILKRAGWLHDIGGAPKYDELATHVQLLRKEFHGPEADQLGSKPSFNPKLCVAHAEARAARGLRKPLSAEEREQPFALYVEEFAALSGGELSAAELRMLDVWWNHPRYSVQLCEQRRIALSPEVEVLVRCNEQPWLYESDPRVIECRAAFALAEPDVRRLLAIVRLADIVENGNNFERRALRGLPLEALEETLRFIEHKFEIDSLADWREVIVAFRGLLARRDAQLFDILLEARNGNPFDQDDMAYLMGLGGAVEEAPPSLEQDWPRVVLGADARPGVLSEMVHEAFAKVAQVQRPDGTRPLRYEYSSSNERDILFDGLWYKFSFVPERRGSFDKPLLLEDVIEDEHDGFDVPHVVPANRPCPFCAPARDEVLGSVRLSSDAVYTLVVNMDPYAEDHVLMAAEGPRAQILTESRLLDLLEFSCALGPEFEGSFTSFSGASMKHWHGQFYRTKTPVWRNFFEGRLQLVGTTATDGVVEGELAGWPVRTVLLMGDSPRSLARQVWRCVSDLMTQEIPYNSKFLYKDGKYYFLLAPRTHGFMSFARYLLRGDPADARFVSGCGSIEAPGGDAVMFFDLPTDLSPSRRTEMARRFAKTLDQTSNWSWQRPRSRKTASRRTSQKQADWSLKPRARIAHRVDSLEAARAAVELGFEFLEIDVQVTRDGVLIVHWGSFPSSTGQEVLAFERDFAELDAILNGQLLRVDAFCDFVRERARIAFDIKDWSDALPGYRKGLLDALVTLAQEKNLFGSAIFESFNIDYVKALVERADAIGVDITVGLAIARGTLLDEEQTNAEIAQAATIGARTLFVYPSDLTLPVAKQVRAAGLSLLSSAAGLSDEVRELVNLAVVDRVDWATSFTPGSAMAPRVAPAAVGVSASSSL